MPRRGPRRVTVAGVERPPPLRPLILRPLATEVLHRWEARLAAVREVNERPVDRIGPEPESGRRRQEPTNRLDEGSIRTAGARYLAVASVPRPV